MGTGKSTVGQIIAAELGYEFVDTDEAIALVHGPIPKFFEENGELSFRKLEREISDVLSKRSRLVISTGGGLMLDADCVAFLEPVSEVFCLSASASEILAGLRKLGPNRVVALSTHKSKELLAELEAKAEALIEQLASES